MFDRRRRKESDLKIEERGGGAAWNRAATRELQHKQPRPRGSEVQKVYQFFVSNNRTTPHPCAEVDGITLITLITRDHRDDKLTTHITGTSVGVCPSLVIKHLGGANS